MTKATERERDPPCRMRRPGRARTHSGRRSLARQLERRLESRKLTENFHKQVDRLEVGQLVVVRIDADAEEEAGVSSVDNLVVSELSVS